ncbi:MAG: DUF3226 domain-containing protein [Campylobacterota bacterium]|nr:DUF3226 domain-containing protein [Campylobacterota bacterium]
MDNISKITISFCEGPHDTAFLYRILKTKCFESFKGTLDKLPKVVGDFVISKNKMAEYNLLKVDSLKNDFVPYKIMHKDEELILLYSLGGDKDATEDENNKRLIILKHFFKNIKINVEDKDNHGEAFVSENNSDTLLEYKFLFFYDADEDKDEKLNIINKYLEKMNISDTLKHNEIKKQDGYSIGAYIFLNENDKGALEDILFDLMKKENEVIFDKAEEFLMLKEDARLKRLKIECKSQVIEKRDKKQKINTYKSIIGVTGQIQNSGVSNVVTIEHSDYLNLQKLNASMKVQEIINFFAKQV